MDFAQTALIIGEGCCKSTKKIATLFDIGTPTDFIKSQSLPIFWSVNSAIKVKSFEEQPARLPITAIMLNGFFPDGSATRAAKRLIFYQGLLVSGSFRTTDGQCVALLFGQ